MYLWILHWPTEVSDIATYKHRQLISSKTCSQVVDLQLVLAFLMMQAKDRLPLRSQRSVMHICEPGPH